MASSAAFFHKQRLNNHVRSSPFQIIRARSTAQGGLQRILQTILSGTGGFEDKVLCRRKSEAEGFGINLNLRLFSFEPQNLAVVGDSSMCSGVGGGVNVLQGDDLSSSIESCNASTVAMGAETCGQKEVIADAGREEGEEDKEEALEVSDVTNTAVVAKAEGDDASGEGRGEGHEELEHGGRTDGQDVESKLGKMDDPTGGGGYLHLLLEAVRHISDDFEADKPTPRPATNNKRKSSPSDGAVKKVAEPRRGARRSHDWLVQFYGAFEEDTAPLVRSKRGRSQALPSRYRDTVLDSWRK